MLLGNGRLAIELDEASSLDIGSLTLDGITVSPGDAVPDDGDPRIRRAVSGFLFTCGPDHIRHPEPVEEMEGRRYALHGSMAGTRVGTLEERRDGTIQEVGSRIRVALEGGGEAEMMRTWRFNWAAGEVSLEDWLVNAGGSPFPPMLMYHMNIAARLLDDRTMLAGGMFENNATNWRFGDSDSKVFCVPALGDNGIARVTLGPIGEIGGRSLHVWFDVGTLPHLQMWRNQVGHCNVLGIEPASHPWQKRPELAAQGLMVPLAPGESRTYRLGFVFR